MKASSSQLSPYLRVSIKPLTRLLLSHYIHTMLVWGYQEAIFGWRETNFCSDDVSLYSALWREGKGIDSSEYFPPRTFPITEQFRFSFTSSTQLSISPMPSKLPIVTLKLCQKLSSYAFKTSKVHSFQHGKISKSVIDPNKLCRYRLL